MLKYITTKDIKYKGQLYKGRKIIAHKDLLKLLLQVPEAIAYSGWRSLAEQKKLVAEGKSKTLNSNHRRGVAVDVINWKEVEPKMRKLGLINDISWDKNHFALGGESKATKYPLIDTVPKVLDECGVKQVSKKKKEESNTQIPITVETPTVPPNLKPESVPETIKLSELPPIKEPTFFELIIKFFKSL